MSRPPTYRDSAVIIRKLDHGEYDRIFTLLTRDHGRLGALAKGVRKPQSRLASALELFNRIDVQLARGRGSLDVLTQAVLLPGTRLPADLERTAYAALVAELADRVGEERHPVEGLYELTAAALEQLACDPEARRASVWYVARALDLLGYGPQLSACAGCGRPLPEAPAAFSPEAGGCLCPDCTQPGMSLVPVAALKVLRVAAAGDARLYSRLRLEAALLAEMEMVLEAQLEHHLDRQLRSLRFLRRLRAEPAPAATG
ncbi:MAG: DNA repair protein RecO [Candidatus Dormibacteraeota bacterium]|nr:DNA repair protein RecO [Candidatus Dormibacteraeota bacterium]